MSSFLRLLLLLVIVGATIGAADRQDQGVPGTLSEQLSGFKETWGIVSGQIKEQNDSDEDDDDRIIGWGTPPTVIQPTPTMLSPILVDPPAGTQSTPKPKPQGPGFVRPPSILIPKPGSAKPPAPSASPVVKPTPAPGTSSKPSPAPVTPKPIVVEIPKPIDDDSSESIIVDPPKPILVKPPKPSIPSAVPPPAVVVKPTPAPGTPSKPITSKPSIPSAVPPPAVVVKPSPAPVTPKPIVVETPKPIDDDSSEIIIVNPPKPILVNPPKPILVEPPKPVVLPPPAVAIPTGLQPLCGKRGNCYRWFSDETDLFQDGYSRCDALNEHWARKYCCADTDRD